MFSRLVFLFAALVAVLALASSVNAYDDRTTWTYKGTESEKAICKKIEAKCKTSVPSSNPSPLLESG